MRWFFVCILCSCASIDEVSDAPTPSWTDPCDLPEQVSALGEVRAVLDGPGDCELLVSACEADACPGFVGPVHRHALDGTVLDTLAEDAAATWVVGPDIVVLGADAQLTAHPSHGAPRVLHEAVVDVEAIDARWLLVTTPTGPVEAVSTDGTLRALTSEGEVLHTDDAPPTVLWLEPEPWAAPACQDGPRGTLWRMNLDIGERVRIANDVSTLLAWHGPTRTAVHDQVDATTADRHQVVTGDGSTPVSFLTLPACEPMPVPGCSCESVSVLLSPDGSRMAWRQSRIELEDAGFGAFYPDVELALVPTDSPDAPPALVACSPADVPHVLNDGVLCNRDTGLGVYDADGGFERVHDKVGAIEPLGSGRFVVQRYDDDAPLVDDIFRASVVSLLDLDAVPEAALTDLAEGYLVEVHDSRWVVFSERPEAWLWSRPEDIGWSILDLEEDRRLALAGPLRPEAVLADAAIVLLGPWGMSEHSPQAAFLAPLWP